MFPPNLSLSGTGIFINLKIFKNFETMLNISQLGIQH